MTTIFTPRLELRLGDERMFRIAPADREALARVLGVTVPESWPVEHYDDDVLKWSLGRLAESEANRPWMLRYVVLRESATLIGMVGIHAPAGDDATVIIGYSILPELRRRGFAVEATQGLIDWAVANGARRIVGDTYPHLVASIGVLEKLGFRHIGAGEGEGVIRYEKIVGERASPVIP